MNNAPAKSRNLWPYAIIAWFVIFASAMGTWIVVAVRQDMDLVRRDYYEEEIRFQQQMDRVGRTQPWRSELRVAYDASSQTITVALPAAHARQQPSGRIQLYRPADARLDRDIALFLNDAGQQQVDAKSLRAGLWKVRVRWTVGGEEFYFDETVVLDGA